MVVRVLKAATESRRKSGQEDPRMTKLFTIPDGLVKDEYVTIGYRADRLPKRQQLCIGVDARLRPGTVIYEGSRIGNRFETRFKQ